LSIKHQINQLFDNFTKLKVLIIGDVMVDSYFSGKVDRISPEAPVPVVSVTSEENRLGGAANVALNIRALEATPILCSVIGNDLHGSDFLTLCLNEGIRTDGIIQKNDRITTVKTRIIGNNHQLLRVDNEKIKSLDESETKEFIERIRNLIEGEKIDVIIFEDYDKGVITQEVIEKVISMAKAKNIPTTADPKKNNFLNYKDISLFKPNLKELREGMKIDFQRAGDELFHQAISELKETLNAKSIFITLSDEGVYFKSDDEEIKIPAHLRNIADVSGAGDTVISVASLCLALGQDGHMISFLSNLAGGLVCEKVGVVPIEKDVLLQEAILSIKID
jgi:rfaE bifunctional protein kinase chain/domain